MRILFSPYELLSELCKNFKKFGMYVYIPSIYNFDEVLKAIPFLTNQDFENYRAIILNGFFYMFFDSEEQMNCYYSQVVGEDGPTKSNPYDGPAKCYALTCNPQGELLTENT